MKTIFFYFLFSLLIWDSNSFFFKSLKNSGLYHNYNIKSLTSKSESKSKSCCLKKTKYIINHNKYNLKLEYNNITDYFFDNKYLSDKKIINISPAGLRGFYEMGICTYIKENYNTDDFIFSGASAGAWNSLLMSYKGNIVNFKNLIFDIDFENIKSIYDLQLVLKKLLLEKFTSNDFDFKKIYIGVTVFEKFKFNNYIFTDFDSLEDALDCIIASSNIPFITGKLILKYRNKLCFDGGFSKDPFIHNPDKNILIHPDIFKTNFINFDNIDIINYDSFDIDYKHLIKLFEQGYKDSIKYDSFIKKNIIDF